MKITYYFVWVVTAESRVVLATIYIPLSFKKHEKNLITQYNKYDNPSLVCLAGACGHTLSLPFFDSGEFRMKFHHDSRVMFIVFLGLDTVTW